MDVIKNDAKEFSKVAVKYTISLELFNSQLSSRLTSIYKDYEKLRFLSYLKDIVETDYLKHTLQCQNPATCDTNKSFEIAIYSIRQQYDQYNSYLGGIDINEKPIIKFYSEGQYFDAFTSIRERIKPAKNSIVLVDGYIDENTLVFFDGKEPSIKLKILTKAKSNTEAFRRAVDLYNKQYENLEVRFSEKFHDRFLIIDEQVFLHIGASLKDVGNKAFMYSEIIDFDVINLLRKKIASEWGDTL